MENEFPIIIEELYNAFVGESQPFLWPERLRDVPLRGHGMWAFYRGLQIGMQLAAVCLDGG